MSIIFGALQRGQFVKNPGVEYYVDGDNGADSASGLSWTDALLTVQAAVDKTVSGRHDRVYVATASGAYDENVTVTSKDYVSIIGVGLSDWGRPDISPSTGVGLVVSLSQGFYSERVFYFSADDNAVEVDSNGWGFDDCRFLASGGDGLFLKGNADDDSYGAAQGLANECMFWENSGAGVEFQYALAPSGIAPSDNEFRDCTFKGNTGPDFLSATDVSGGNSGLFLTTIIAGCRFLDVGGAHVYMDLDQGNGSDLAVNQALIIGCFFADEAITGTQIAISGQPNMMFVGNYDAVGLVDGSGFNN
jgi:hypothetical protein